MVNWIDETWFELDGVEFHTLGDVDAFTPEFHRRSDRPSRADSFTLQKTRPMVDRYVDLVERLSPRSILEIGIFKGGGTALLAELVHPDKLVAIELNEERVPALDQWARERGLEDRVHTYYGVSQDDTKRILEIVRSEFDSALDLVIDDASHALAESRATFNALFPLVRPGGIYVLEDWGLAQAFGLFTPDKPPLTNLLVELQIAWGRFPTLVEETITVPGVSFIRRGALELDPDSFDISETFLANQSYLHPTPPT
jgi:SAM-dependent methyltransferase